MWQVVKRRLPVGERSPNPLARLQRGVGTRIETLSGLGDLATTKVKRIMRTIRRFLLVAVLGMIARRLVVRRVGGPKGVETMLMDVMPKMMDRAFGKLEPAKRQEMLTRCHAMLDGLEEKYGTGIGPVEEPAGPVAA